MGRGAPAIGFRIAAICHRQQACSGAVETRNGLRILSDRVAADWPAAHRLQAIGDQPPALALDQALQAIGARYGERTADIVGLMAYCPQATKIIEVFQFCI